MDWIKFPPLATLKAFEAAGRNKNYSRAGRELNISHAAVSQQVRALETFLGLQLAQRSGRGIALTAEGEKLSQSLTKGFLEIADTLNSLNEAELQRALNITMTPSFAMNWFMPRMQLFNSAHPEIDLVINPTTDLVDFVEAGCDLAIRFGTGDWPGLQSRLLMPSNFVIVAAPKLIKGLKCYSMESLATLPWIEELGTLEVSLWLSQLGLERTKDTQITSLPGYMVIEALRNGQGAAGTARLFVEDDLKTGKLQILFEADADDKSGYYLVWREGFVRPQLKTFMTWIKSAVE